MATEVLLSPERRTLTTVQALPWDGPVLVGRDGELAQVLRHLDAGRSRAIGIAGGPSFGKTLFLSSVETAASERGWLTARRDPAHGPLTVGSGTTEEELVGQVRTLLGLGSVTERDRIGRGNPAVPLARLLVEDLAARGRCILLIDDFRPAEIVRAWLTSRFLPEMKAASVPIVVVAAGLPDAIEPLRAFWDDVLVLGPLSEAAVRAHFERVGTACQPPLTAAEIDAYVQDSLEKPHVLNALTRLLAQLTAAPSAGSPA